MTRVRQHRADILIVFLLLALVVTFYRQIALTRGILVGYDTFTYFYPNESYLAESLRQGRLPLWNPYLFTGVPFLANMQTAVLYPFNLLFLLFPVPYAYAYSVLLHAFMAGLFAYLFCRISLGLGLAAAFVGATTFMFSGFFGSLVGHINQLHAATWLPLLFLLCDLALRRRSIRLALLAAVPLALQFLAGHSQETYMSLFALALFCLFRMAVDWTTSARDLRFKAKHLVGGASLFALLLACGIGLAAVQLVPSLELSALSIRAGGMSFKEATAFSLPPSLLARSFLPVFGDPQPFSEWLAYIGVFGLFLALFAIAVAPRAPFVWFALGLSLLSLFFAFGQYNPMYPRAFRLIPGLSLFRVPARWIYLYTFGGAILAAYGASFLGNLPTRADARHLLARYGVLLLACGAAVLALYFRFRSIFPIALPSQNVSLIWLVLALGAMLAIVAAVLLRRNLSWLAAAVVVAELLAAGQYLDLNKTTLPEAYSTLRPAVAYFQADKVSSRDSADKGVYRVLPISENDYDPGDLGEIKEMLRGTLDDRQAYDYVVATKLKETLAPNLPLSFDIASLDGYDGGLLPLRSYVQMKQLFPLREKQAADGRLREELEGIPDPRLLGLLNVKYIVTDRIRDAWVDGVYYDLAFTQTLDATRKQFDFSSVPRVESTAIGIISNLLDARNVPDGEVVAWVDITDNQGIVSTFPLRAGSDTSEAKLEAEQKDGGVAHHQARKAKPWKGDPTAWDYIAKLSLPRVLIPRSIVVRYTETSGSLNLRGLTLIDDRTQTSAPVVLSPSLEITELGDLKTYQNKDVWPRAFIARKVSDTPSGDIPTWQKIRIAMGASDADSVAAVAEANDRVEIANYAPENITLETSLEKDGYLVLTDSYYPGWHAYVDGSEKLIQVANGIFRAVALPAGSHEVRFVYEPLSLKLGILISALAMIAVLGLLVALPRTK